MIGLASALEVVNSFDELADKGVKRLNEEFAKWSPVLLAVAQGLEQLRTEAYNMLNWLQRAIAAADRFWKARAAITNPKAWESPEAMRDALRHGLGIEGEASPPAMPELAQPRDLTRITIKPPVGGGGSRAGGGRAGASPKDEGDITGIPRPEPRRWQDFDQFQAAADRIEERNSPVMDRLRRQWLQASGERIGLIEINRDAQLAALDEQELGE